MQPPADPLRSIQLIRWQLPLSYALIALLAALALSTVLINLLRDHYANLETIQLTRTANLIEEVLWRRNIVQVTAESIPPELPGLSAIFDVRIELLDSDLNVLADTGVPHTLTVALAGSPLRRPLNSIQPFFNPSTLSTDGTLEITATATPLALGSAPALGIDANGAVILMPTALPSIGETSSDDSLQTPAIIPAVGQAIPLPMPPSTAPADDPTLFTVDAGQRLPFVMEVPRSSQVVMTSIGPRGVPNTGGFLRVSASPAIGSEIVDSVARGAWVAGTVAVILAAGVGYGVSTRITHPLNQLKAAANNMAAGEYWVRTDIQRGDELGQLAEAFNSMAGQVESTIAALRRFVADAAHELHTPLTALRTDLELLRHNPQPQHVQHALRQAQRLESLCDDLLDLSRLESPALFWQGPNTPLDLNTLLGMLAEVYASRAEQRDIAFEFQVDPILPPLKQGNATQLQRAIANLLDNALKFTPDGGQITLQACSTPQHVVIRVTDNGIGIPPAELPHVFGRFYRGSNTHTYPGSGLGLAITDAIIRAHQGRIDVCSRAGYTCFEVYLPTHLTSQITKP